MPVYAAVDQEPGNENAKPHDLAVWLSNGPAHLYYLLMPDLEQRQAMLRHLAEHGVQGAFHYQPLHDAPAGRRLGRTAPGGCPVTESVADRLLRLPLYPGLSDADVEHVLGAVCAFRAGRPVPPAPRGAVGVPA